MLEFVLCVARYLDCIELFKLKIYTTCMLADQAPSSFDIYCGQALIDGVACTRKSNWLTVDFVAPRGQDHGRRLDEGHLS